MYKKHKHCQFRGRTISLQCEVGCGDLRCGHKTVHGGRETLGVSVGVSEGVSSSGEGECPGEG